MKHARFKAPSRIWTLVSALAVLGLVLGLTPSPALGQTTTAIEFDPMPLTLAPSGSGSVDVWVRDFPAASGLAAYNLTITYDEAVVNATAVLGGDAPFNGAPTANLDTPGQIIANAFHTQAAPSGDIRILQITFAAVGAGGASSALTFASIDLTDANGDTVSAVPHTGAVQIASNAPTAVNDSYDATEETQLVVSAPGVLQNDTDPNSDPLTAAVVANPSNGTLALNSNGGFTYTPNTNFIGTDTFTYRANDGTNNSNTATVTINVAGTNDAPVANNDSHSTNEDTALVVNAPGVLTNDTDVDGDTLTAAVVANPTNGSVTLNTNGSFTYTPNSNFNGSDSFTYRANDGTTNSNTATVNITVTAVNDRPTASAQSVSTPQNLALSITLQGTDVDAGTTLTFAVASQPSNGSLSGTGANLTYTPNANYTGTDSFTFTASDGTLTSDPATVSITVIASAPPVVDARIRNPVYTGRTWTLTASFTDADAGDTHTATIDWGDGTVSQVSVNQAADTLSGFHRFAAAGTYTIHVRVTDDKGVTGEDTILVVVRPHPRLRL